MNDTAEFYCYKCEAPLRRHELCMNVDICERCFAKLLKKHHFNPTDEDPALAFRSVILADKERQSNQ